MHQNAPLPDKKNQKNLWGGAQPTGEGIPLPRPHLPRRLRRLDSRAFGARRSRSFSFTTRTLGDTISPAYNIMVVGPFL